MAPQSVGSAQPTSAGRRIRTAYRVALVAAAALACGDDPAGKQPPATVSGARPEATLASVTLTPEAEARLGIETASVESRRVARTRNVGGECMVPPGRSMSIDAPFAGLILSPNAEGASLPSVGTALAASQPVLRLVPLLSDEADLRSDSEQEVATARAHVETARARARRIDQLFAKGTVSDQDVEIAHLSVFPDPGRATP